MRKKQILAMAICGIMALNTALPTYNALAAEENVESQESEATEVETEISENAELEKDVTINETNETENSLFEEVQSVETENEEKADFAIFSGPIAINAKNFPDEVFRKIVSDRYDTDKDLFLSAEEISKVETMGVNGKGIKTLEGIEFFTNLSELYCNNNSIKELDLRNNEKLEHFECSKNSMTDIQFGYSNYTSYVDCSENNFGKIDVKGLLGLRHLDCSANALTSLDLSRNASLEYLYCSKNKLTTLNLSENTKLIELFCFQNGLTKLNLTYNKYLEELDCSENTITSLDVTNNEVLSRLVCEKNNMTTLKLGKNAKLTELICNNNSIKTMNLTGLTALKVLYCFTNRLTSLDTSANTRLVELWCDDNRINSLDVSKNVNLKSLDCKTNNLACIDLSNNSKLDVEGVSDEYYVDVDDNNYYTSSNTVDLSSIPNFNIAKMSNISGGALNGNILKFTTEDGLVAYDYDCGKGVKTTFWISTTGNAFLATPAISKTENVRTGVKVTWKNVAGALKYRVYRKTTDGKWTNIGETKSTTFTDKTAVSGTKYTYTVRCINSTTGKTISDYNKTGKSITFLSAPVLGTPVKTTTGVKVSWNKVAGAAKYRVFRKTGSESWTRIGDTTSASYVDTTAVKGKTYAYTVRCVSSDGKTYTSAYDTMGKTITYK